MASMKICDNCGEEILRQRDVCFVSVSTSAFAVALGYASRQPDPEMFEMCPACALRLAVELKQRKRMHQIARGFPVPPLEA